MARQPVKEQQEKTSPKLVQAIFVERLKGGPRLRECCTQSQAGVVSKSTSVRFSQQRAPLCINHPDKLLQLLFILLQLHIHVDILVLLSGIASFGLS